MTCGWTEFVYDALGRRLKTIEKNGLGQIVLETHYVYDGLNMIAELTGTDTLVAFFTHGVGIDDPLIMRYSGADYFYFKNHQGSVIEVRNISGGVVKTYKYDAFGNIKQETGPTVNRGFTYTSRERHSRSGLYYYRARWYSPTLGRFLTQDPIGHLGGVNLYAYVSNDPVNLIDPYGLKVFVLGGFSEYNQAIQYLSRDPGMRDIIQKLEGSSTKYTVIVDNSGEDRYKFQNNVVRWNPTEATSECPNGEGWRHSPALDLGHELAHAAGPWCAPWISLIPDPQYDNKEDKRVITGPESAAARTLGEDVRYNHGGFGYTVQSPTMR